MEIIITPPELAQASLSDTHLAQAVKALREDGFVVLADVVDHTHLDILHERMEADSQRLIKDKRWGGAGSVLGHLQQGPPPFAPYVFSDIMANPFAIQVSKAILGEGLYNRFYNGNANCPGSGTQPLHGDAPHLWQDMTIAHPTVSLVVNVSLVNVTAENGATELWPGTHLVLVNRGPISAEVEAQRRELAPPVRATARKGSLLLRDMRLWHRGVPNHSNEIRHMIAMVHNVKWLQRSDPLLFNTGCEDAFPASDLDHNVQFTEQPLEYLFTRTPTIKA
ncbi:MAG: phytanoyl-CoA dioxygenase family protein [Chloroflexi bacterium]|nr:phytanoyl-CoA dioxygenase family protein [Chloroflexota bacterium]